MIPHICFITILEYSSKNNLDFVSINHWQILNSESSVYCVLQEENINQLFLIYLHHIFQAFVT
jgi:hypothetical protein